MNHIYASSRHSSAFSLLSFTASLLCFLLWPSSSLFDDFIYECMRYGDPKRLLSLLEKEVAGNGGGGGGHVFSPRVREDIVVSLLRACAKHRDGEMGSEIHSYLTAAAAAPGTGLLANVFVGTALIHMYAKCGAMVEARQVLDSLPARNVVSWNALISGYSQHGHGSLALDCYEEMRSHGVSPDAATLSCTMKACASLLDLGRGRELHADASKMGTCGTNRFVANALVDMYSKCRSMAEAHQAMERHPSRDVVTWNALIAGYAECGWIDEALGCFEQAQIEGISPDAVTFASCLKACGIVGDDGRGGALLAQIRRIGSLEGDPTIGTASIDMYAKCNRLDRAREAFDSLRIRDVVSWSALIAGYSRSSRSEEALMCFEEMKLEGVAPNAVTLSAILKSCGSIGAAHKGEEMREYAQRKGWLGSDQIVGNAIIDMYLKCGLLAKAQEVFDELPARNVVSWTSLMTGYVQLGSFREVLSTFDKMRMDDVDPNPVTLVSLLNACSHEGCVETGEATFFGFMSRSQGICCPAELELHHSIMVDLFSRSGQMDRAVAMVRGSAPHPSIATCLALLSACRRWHHVDLARDAFGLAMQIDGMNAAAHVCMRNIYAEAEGSLKCC